MRSSDVPAPRNSFTAADRCSQIQEKLEIGYVNTGYGLGFRFTHRGDQIVNTLGNMQPRTHSPCRPALR